LGDTRIRIEGRLRSTTRRHFKTLFSVALSEANGLSPLRNTRIFATLRMVRQAKLWRFLIDVRFYPW
jgi:hypothetical protein